MQVIQETDVDKVRWGAEEPSCILYTCYPFGILTHTPQRYAVYADPVSADEYGVYRQRQPKIKMTEVHPPQIYLGHFLWCG